jgi:hypothetical protein
MSAHDSSLLDYPPQPLEEFAHEPGCSDGIDFRALDVGTVVNVHTRYSCYRLVVVDPEERRALVTGGRLFVESTEVRVEGATAGGAAIKRGWLGIGLRLEMLNLDKRITTSVVQSLTIDPPPASMVC